MTDDGFRRGTNHQRLGELFAPANRYNGQLGRKAFDVMLFLVYETARNQQRERYVLMARGLEAAVERLLDIFPESLAVRANDHAAADGRVIGELRLEDQLVVPLGEILCAGGKLFFGHAAVYPFFSVANPGAE